MVIKYYFTLHGLLQAYLSLRFELWLKWTDHRLGYSNLHEEFHQNKLTRKKEKQLWKPFVVFKNAVKTVKLKFASSDKFLKPTGSCWTNCDLERLKSTEASMQEKHEAKLFDSNDIEIIWVTTHLMKFKCDFDLYYLPFDHQTCYMDVSEIYNKAK